VLVTIASTAACAAPPAGESGIDTTEQAASTTAAVYSVPVEPALEAAATFPVSDVDWEIEGGVASLDYDLPLGLTGIRQKVRLEGTYDAVKKAWILAGPMGTGDCTITGTALHCLEHLPGITVNVPAAAARTPAGIDAAKRLAVIQQFPVDPVGILDATLRTKGDDDDDSGRRRGRGRGR